MSRERVTCINCKNLTVAPTDGRPICGRGMGRTDIHKIRHCLLYTAPDEHIVPAEPEDPQLELFEGL